MRLNGFYDYENEVIPQWYTSAKLVLKSLLSVKNYI